ncbi:hypothetical protein [Anaerosalibacter sp. Marseille-P3206]|uniref:hypothetical protein n=1 Tax=Anaerosalibacter sp. Marseille-P3206 TaxID=1871005 RepID=UPI0009873667|nr:hypothetical protein [Anaerosalibacter sp. Marseille-P3206]
MRIDDFTLKEILTLELDGSPLKEGSIIDGEIIEIFEDSILLDIENLGLIEGKIEIPIDNLEGKNLKFLVKSNDENSIKLVPLIEEQPKTQIVNQEEKDFILVNAEEDTSAKTHIIKNILKEHNIVENKTTVEMIETLFKYNIPINKENLEKSIRVLDKIDYICSKTSEEKVILLNNESDPVKSQIMDFVLVDNSEYPEKKNLDFIYDEIKPMISDGEVDSKLIKTVIFLLKNNIKISVNNLKNIFRLMDNEEIISKELIDKLNDHSDKSNTNEKKVDSNSKVNITFTEKDIVSLREYNDDVKKKLELIKDFSTNEKTDGSKDIKETIKELGNRIDFLNDMNKELNFMYIPLTIKDGETDGSISFLKKKRHSKGKSEKLNVFINLNMKYLGNVKIMCEAFDDLVNINFNLDEKHISFIKSYEKKLYNLIEEKGYKLNALNYITDNKTSLLDTLIDNHKPYYYLDVRV